MYSLHTTAEKAIVIACNDCISSYLDMNHNNLSKDFVLPGSKDEGMITHFMDKGAMAQLAVKSGLNIPKSIIISTANPEFESITYPCISKPLVSKNGSKSDIVICEDESALRKYLNHCRCDKIIIYIQLSKRKINITKKFADSLRVSYSNLKLGSYRSPSFASIYLQMRYMVVRRCCPSMSSNLSLLFFTTIGCKQYGFPALS